MADGASKSDVVSPGRSSTDVAGDNDGNNYEVMSSPTPEDDIYEPVTPIVSVRPMTKPLAENPEGYLIPYPDGEIEAGQSSGKNSTKDKKAEVADNGSSRTGVISVYEDLWAYKKQDNTYPISCINEPIYDEVHTVIPSSMPGAKIIPIEEPTSAYDEVIFNDGRYRIPSRQWDSDSDAFESDFDDDTEAPNYFGQNLEELYVNLENRKLTSPVPRTMPFGTITGDKETRKSKRGVLGNCLPFTKSSKQPSGEEESPMYVDPNNLGEKEPVMPPLSLDLSTDEAARYEIVQKILTTEAAYKENLSQLVQIEQDARDRQLLELENLDVIFCSLQSILQCHEMFSMVLGARMNEWTVDGKLGDIICASFSKSTTTMAYTDFVNNFLAAIDTYRDVCKTNNVFSNYVKAKLSSLKPKVTFHDLMLKPLERFPEFIILIQDLLEVTPVSHVDRVPLQLALTQLECLAELINLRRKDSEMKNQLSYLDTQISQLSKPLSSSGRAFIRQDDMIHCLIDGVSVVGTKKLRLVLLSDMLLCLSPVGKKKRLVPGLLNTPKYKFKLRWNVPLSDVEFVEYGSGVCVAAGKYGTTTTYSDQGKYRQATMEIQKHIEDLQHDLAVIGQIAGLASSLRGEHQLLDQHKVERWFQSVENTITEELKTVNMFWLELSLPTKSGQHNYVFNLSSPTVKEEWQADAMNAKLALESRNNPGWYLPEEEVTGGLSILRRNMPLLAELFDLFLFNARSRVEHTITYPVETSTLPLSMASRGLGHYVWISARGEMQGHVSVLRFERNACTPRLIESFNVCPGTVYSMALIPAMNSRRDQSADRYHTKYGFPFPTVWLGSHSSRIYIYDAESDDRSRALMELKLRDAPLAMKYAMRKVYVGLANGTVAIFRSNTSGHWNLVQPSILPLGRYPVAVIADVKDKLWCSSGSQIYVVSKKGDRIQRIIAVDSNMKNLVKHVESCGVGVWVSVWKKATIKLYHAETCDMMQEVNVVSPLLKMKNDVDSQVQYLSADKISVTALLFIPGFLWVGTSVGLILLYPLPKMQGVPRVIGRACVAFHAHCGPVRSLLAIPQGTVAVETTSDDVSDGGEDPNEINRKFTMLADSEESVESDEEFYFVDDNNTPSPKKKQFARAGVTQGTRRLKVTVKGPQQTNSNSEDSELSSNVNVNDFNFSKPDDFAKMMESFGGFKNVRSFKNQLFTATHAEANQKEEHGTKISGTNVPSGMGKNEAKLEASNEDSKQTGDDKDSDGPNSMNTSADDLNSEKAQHSHLGILLASSENSDTINDTTSVSSVVSERKSGMDTIREPQKDTSKQAIDEKITLVEKSDLVVCRISQAVEDMKQEDVISTQTERKRSSNHEAEKTNTSGRSSPQVSTISGNNQPEKRGDDLTSSEEIRNSSLASKSSEKSQETYVTVLPGSEEKSKNNSDAEKEELETGQDSLLSKTGKTRDKCLSYLVVSSGEGHVDLRLKVKSKQDLKKDGQSMFLIWRVNSKI